jgi:hypothetical protein
MKSLLICIIAFISTNIMSAQTKVLDSTAIRIIDRMSTIIGDLTSVSFTLESKVDENDQDIGLNSKYTTNQVYFKGPDKMMMDLQRNSEHRSIWYNGKSLVYYFYNENNYAIISCPPTIIETIDMVNENYGVDFPSADFFNPTLTDDMLRNFDQIRYHGKREINKKECHYIIATKKDMHVQLWIETSAMNLPYKMVIMYLNDGNEVDTQYEATFKNWQINPELPVSMFEFNPPMDARKIKLLPINNQ